MRRVHANMQSKRVKATPEPLLAIREWVTAVRAYQELAEPGRVLDDAERRVRRLRVEQTKAHYVRVRHETEKLTRARWAALSRRRG